MKFYENQSTNPFPEVCLLIHDIPPHLLNRFRDYVTENQPREDGLVSPPVDVDEDENYAEIPGEEIEDLIIQCAINPEFVGLIPCFMIHDKGVFYQSFSRFSETSMALDLPELTCTAQVFDYRDKVVESKLGINVVTIPKWNTNGIIVSILWRPFTFHGVPSLQFRVHDICRSSTSEWNYSSKIASFLDQVKWLKTRKLLIR